MGPTNVYIDGFNFYYGCIKGTAYHWLDLERFSQALLRGHQIGKIRYFTARVDDRPGDPHQSRRQDAFLRALSSCPRVEVHLGQFRTRKKPVRLVKPRPDGRLFDFAYVTEEKGTDVSLASHLLWDAFHRAIDAAMVVSNDSDLQEPIKMAMELGVKVIVVNPHRHTGQANHLFGSDTRNLRKTHLEQCQLPSEVRCPDGRLARRPNAWGT